MNDPPESTSASAPVVVAAHTFGPGLQMLGFGDAIQQQRVLEFAEAIQQQRVRSAVEELAALQRLAALANWPASEPAATAPRAVRRPVAGPLPASVSAQTLETALLDAINARRAAAGLAPVSVHARLTQAATAYAGRMSDLSAFGHSVDGSTLEGRLRAAGFADNVMMGEVLSWSTGAPDAAAIVRMWMESAPHREQILSASFRLAGAGCAFDGTATLCVVDLAG